MPWKDKSKYKSEAYREYMRNYQRSWHQRHKAKRLTKIYERRERLWEFYNQLKENLECTQCGESHPATLQFHHLDPQKKDFNLSESIRQGYSAERIKREIAKCTVLCANCHAKLHYEWAKEEKQPLQDGLAAEFQQIEQELAVSQEEEFAHAAENQYVPTGVDLDLYDDSDIGP
jgi:hypothetical protein